MTKTEHIIDGLVRVHTGTAPQYYQDDFRQALELLVQLAKFEERQESDSPQVRSTYH